MIHTKNILLSYQSKLSFAFLLLIFTIGCIDQINLTLEDEDEFLVVDGGFSGDTGPHQIKLYYATGQRVKAQRLVSDATINLYDANEKIAEFTEISPGNYQIANTELKGEVGQMYHIDITLASGVSYQSQPEMMPQKIRGDSVFFEFSYRDIANAEGIVRKPFVEAFIATPLPQNTASYWIKWETNIMWSFPEVVCSPFGPPPLTCFITEENTQQEINLLSSSELQATYLPKKKVKEKEIPFIDFEFRGKHYFLSNQQSITQEAFEYWSKINQVANQTGSIFDTPPAPVKGNIERIDNPNETVLGYFELSNTDSLRGFLNEGKIVDFFEFPINFCQDVSNPFANNNRECCNCRRIDDSTLDRPSWW